jgi:CRP-like cAMP-binding protein
MARVAPSKPINHMLSALSAGDYARLAPHLNAARLPLRRSLEDANKPIRQVYFPEEGFVSVVAAGTRDRQSEVGLIGREGMTGISVVMGDDRSPHLSYVQAAGHGRSMSADSLRQAMQENPSIRILFLHFAQAFMVQTTHTAVANGRGNIEQRLARWLLMAHDRINGDELPLTHEFLALMLNVRRAGVTEGLQSLNRKGVVKVSRGHVAVTDRAGLVACANGLYGIPEAEYLRLTGWKSRHHRSLVVSD